MTYSLYRRTRSARLTVTTPEGQTIRVDNLTGDSGFSIEFEARRVMSESLGEFSVSAYNLPPEAIAVMESAQVRQVDDLDRMLKGLPLQVSQVQPQGDDALAAGFLICEVEAGYDGTMSRVFRAVGARAKSGYIEQQGRDENGRFTKMRGGLTYRTTISALDALDGVLLGLPLRSFPGGSTVFELVDYLRQIAGLGPGNFTYANLFALIGDAKLSNPFHVSGGQALAYIKKVFEWMPVRWFVDDRELWICGRDDLPNPNGFPAYVPDDVWEPDLLTARPRRDDGGRVLIECLLTPRGLPGRLCRLTPGGLALALQGLSPTEQQIAYAQVPPGLYRTEWIAHTGATSDMDRWTTTALLRPGVAPDAL